MNNILLRKGFRVVLAVLSTVFIFILIWVILDCFPRNVLVEDQIIDYESESNIDYYVISNPIDNMDGETIQESGVYISSLVTDIKLEYNYFFRADDYIDSRYNYYIFTVLKSIDEDNIIWQKKIDIVELTKGELDNTKIVQIKGETNIPFSTLYDEAWNYKNLTDKDVILEVNVQFENSFKSPLYDNYIISTSDNYISLPITNKTFRIDNLSKLVQKKSVSTNHEERSVFNSYLFSLAMICFVAIIPVTIMSYVSLFNLSNYDEYKRRLKAIKRKYYGYIVTRNTVPSFKRKEIIEVKDIKDLIDHIDEEEIVFFEKEVGSEAWFYIEKKKEVYLYILILEHRVIDMSDNTKIKPLKKHKK